MTSLFAFASEQTIGRREVQQDSGYVADFTGTARKSGQNNKNSDSIKLLAVLADGMGGQGSKTSGTVASETLCNSFVQAFTNGSGSTVNRLEAALETGNNSIAEIREQNPELGKLGTTVVGATIDAKGLAWVSVGDSHLYLFRDSELHKLNEDHSEAGQRVAEGINAPNDPELDQYRNQLESAIMGDTIGLIDLPKKHVALKTGDVLVLASDGLDTLSRDQLREIINQHRNSGPKVLASELIDQVESADNPKQDNTFVIVVSMNANVPDEERTARIRPAIMIALLMAVFAICGALYAKYFLSGAGPTAEPQAPPANTKPTIGQNNPPAQTGPAAGPHLPAANGRNAAQTGSPLRTGRKGTAAPEASSSAGRAQPNSQSLQTRTQPAGQIGSPATRSTGVGPASGSDVTRQQNATANSGSGAIIGGSGETAAPARQIQLPAKNEQNARPVTDTASPSQVPAAGSVPAAPRPVQPAPPGQ